MPHLNRLLLSLTFLLVVLGNVSALHADIPSATQESQPILTTQPADNNALNSSLSIEHSDNPDLPDKHPAQGSDQWIVLISIVALIALVAGFVHSGIGFGFGIVAIGLMPLVIDARHTHLLVSLCAVPVQMGTVWAYRKGVVWRPLLFALAGAVIGLPLGLWLFNSINLDWLTRGTGSHCC
ncbi:sulfite exporter TauE/SafE family protein [Rhodopirellula sallentina]|uniref:sulfite exporter TauE/SafE family protein n=1 Tax=Rhodopirellula sallentina TaxID=1263869 RepID=UPI001360B0F4|nr:sulfite exporter TauE/SafE family protein [Rhodopirellula sallentina]